MGEVRLLLVEDSRADAELAKRVLGRVGSVEHCTTLASALARLADPSRPAPSIVVVDLSLPDAQGSAVLERLVAAGSPPVVVLSGSDDPDGVRAALENGARGYLVKGASSAGEIVRLLGEVAGGATRSGPAE